MNNLWTPWRMEHIQGQQPPLDHCLFEPPTTRRSCLEHLLLYRDKKVVVLLNRFPHTNGHLMVAPARHTGSITDLANDESAVLMQMIRQATTILDHHLRPDGFNIGCNIGSCAGAGIADHLHFHIVPRWKGDHNFLSVLGQVRSIPEHLETTFHNLEPDFAKLFQQDIP